MQFTCENISYKYQGCRILRGKKNHLQKKIHGIRLSEAFAETDKFFETKWQNLNILRQKQNISQEKKRV